MSKSNDSQYLDSLRERYENGDNYAVLEAILYLAPFLDASAIPEHREWKPEGRIKSKVVYFGGQTKPPKKSDAIPRATQDNPLDNWPEYPEWLDRAVKNALFQAIRFGEDSIQKAFGLPVYSGNQPPRAKLLKESEENRAYAVVLGIRDAKGIMGGSYPPGQCATSIASAYLHVSEPTLKDQCKRARGRGIDSAGDSEFEKHRTRIRQLILGIGRYPPWEDVAAKDYADYGFRGLVKEKEHKKRKPTLQ